MGDRIDIETDHLPADLQDVVEAIGAVALSRRGNELALLELLRVLEQLHASIRDEWFQEAMPTNRQRLYAFLRDIEVNGGWPYIQRMRLRSLLDQIEQQAAAAASAAETESNS